MAAQRFRGENSPDAKQGELHIEAAKPLKIRRRKKPGGFALTLMFLAPFPLLLDGFSKITDAAPIAAATAFGTYALFVLATWTLREGIKAETAYNERKIARPPMFPRKLIAACLSGSAVLLAAWLGWEQALFTSIAFGALTVAAHLVAFGFDPMRRKGLVGFNEYETDRMARAVEKAEAIIADIESAASRINIRSVERKVEGLLGSVKEMLRVVEQDPRDLTRARKYMGVYLAGARDATVKFAELTERGGNAASQAEYLSLIEDLQTSFEGQREALLLDNQSDLDIEIEVLQERLHREGHLADNK